MFVSDRRRRTEMEEIMKQIKTEDAVGAVLCHDITEIVRGVRKGARFKKGHIVKEEDTIEKILTKYEISKEDFENYNDINNIKSGDKVIIPKKGE